MGTALDNLEANVRGVMGALNCSVDPERDYGPSYELVGDLAQALLDMVAICRQQQDQFDKLMYALSIETPGVARHMRRREGEKDG